MRAIVSYIFLLLLSGCIFGPVGTSKVALKKINEGDLAKAQKWVTKGLEKDSLSPAPLFAKSRLLIAKENFIYYDSAYLLINRARTIYDTLESRVQYKLARAGIDSMGLKYTKEVIDSLAYARARNIHTEEGYISYIDRFPTAFQVEEAKQHRNMLAFAKAKAENSYQGYKGFMTRYPEAKQVPEARELYERLYFINSVADGKLASYISFLQRHPTTPYRKEAERKIFEVLTAENTLASYLQFIKKYPDSYWEKTAINRAYHIAKATGETLPRYLWPDSLVYAHSLEGKELLPFYKNKGYSFMDMSGRPFTGRKFQSINSDYLCSTITEDFFITSDGVVGRNGEQIISSVSDAFDMGYGFLKYIRSGKTGVVHKSGERVLPAQYEDVQLINHTFLSVKTTSGWHLYTLHGIKLLADNFSEIFSQGNFIFFVKNNLIEVKTLAQLVSAADNEPLPLNYVFSDYDLLDNGLLWMEAEHGEVVFNQQLDEIIPYGAHRITPVKKAFLVEQLNDNRLFDINFREIARGEFVQMSNDWIAFEADSVWQLISVDELSYKFDIVGELQLLGGHFAIAYQSDTTTVYFPGGKLYRSLGHTAIKLLAATGAAQYLQIKEGRKTRVFNEWGDEVYNTSRSLGIAPIGNEYLILEKSGKKGLASTLAKDEVLRIAYDAIGNYNNGYVAVLDGRKFGLFNDQKEVFIRPWHEKNLIPYNDQYFIGARTNKGVVDKNGNIILDFIYDEIKYWTDSSALAKIEGKWQLVGLPGGNVQLDGIFTYTIEPLKDEKIMIARIEEGYGVYSDYRGEIVPPTFNDIVPITATEGFILFTEKHIEEAGFYVVIYYDLNGRIFFKQALEAEDYDKLYCVD